MPTPATEHAQRLKELKERVKSSQRQREREGSVRSSSAAPTPPAITAAAAATNQAAVVANHVAITDQDIADLIKDMATSATQQSKDVSRTCAHHSGIAYRLTRRSLESPG